MTGFGKNLCAGMLFVNVTVRSIILPLILSPTLWPAASGAGRRLKASWSNELLFLARPSRRGPYDIDSDLAWNRIDRTTSTPRVLSLLGGCVGSFIHLSVIRPADVSRRSSCFDRDGASNPKGAQRSNQFASREPAPNQDKQAVPVLGGRGFVAQDLRGLDDLADALEQDAAARCPNDPLDPHDVVAAGMNQRAEPSRERRPVGGVAEVQRSGSDWRRRPSTACGRQGFGIDAGDVRQIGRGAHDGARNGRAWVEDAKSRNEAAQALGLRGVHFGDHEPVGGLDLPTTKIFVPNLREPMQGVDRHDDLTHHDVMLQDGICDYGVDDAARLGKPAGFEHDAVDCPRGDISPHPIVADVAKQCHKGGPRLTAGAAAPENT